MKRTVKLFSGSTFKTARRRSARFVGQFGKYSEAESNFVFFSTLSPAKRGNEQV
ncbi:MAG: hypothetical protein MSS85_00065 [Pyramidobacter sp.]|nr:hypothetical protein [Pyramidobacter sp.]